MKKENSKSHMVTVVLSILTATVLAATVVLNYVATTVFDGLATSYLGTIGGTSGTDDEDTEYYTSDYADAEELYEAASDLGAEIAEQGVVLLQNNDAMLPLSLGTTVSLFGTASVDLVCGGSGSGAGTVELNTDFKTALEASGLSVNETLWNFYESGNGAYDDEGNAYGIGAGSINFGASFDWSINEVPAERIQAEDGLEETFAGTVAIYVVSRTGGEDGDLPRDMEAYGGEAGEHYLEFDSTELGMLEYLNETFDEILLIVNTNNTMELGEVAQFENVKAVISAPGLGRMGAYGLANVITGYDGDEQISPSGHLVDTFVYDNYSSPAMQNMGDYRYTGTDYCYVSYSEGIYVGYRYYETRYEDTVMGTENTGDYDYDSTVIYPFGYGLSYTTFEWSDFSMEQPDENGDITVSVTVTNIGDWSGMEVVQLYFQSPYTEYDQENGIEKASVELCGYGKTSNLAPGESETIVITVNLEEFKAYDTYGAGTCILDAGMYYLTVAADAHEAVKQILAAKGYDTDAEEGLVGTYEQAELDTLTYSTDSSTGAQITNQFADAELSDVEYLSRSNWTMMDDNGLRYGEAGTQESPMEQNGVAFEHEIDDETLAALDSTDSGNPLTETWDELPEREIDHDLELVDLRGLDFNDELWDDLLEELSLDEVRRIVYVNGYSSLGAIESIHKPASNENDGPAGINDMQAHESIATGDTTVTMGWSVEVLLASTWNEDLARQMGDFIGEDGLYSDTVGWYGPAMNIHRTPFAGRNFEYYSEDPFLSGSMATAEVEGAAQKGMITYIKHFALNDQETNRSGIATWANEQSIREIYLTPFETVIKNATMTIQYIDAETGEVTWKEMQACNAMMSSYNRIGATWSGGNYNLITGVVRTEWGFNGLILTDYNQNQEYMDTEQMLLAGADSKLRTLDSGFTVSTMKKDATLTHYAYESAHRYLYVQTNSAVMNGLVHGAAMSSGIPVYKILLGVLDVTVALMVILLCRRIWRDHRKATVIIEKTESSNDQAG